MAINPKALSSRITILVPRLICGCYTRNVRVRQLLGAAIVAICVGVPVVEAFDRWDQTLSDGNDSEANVVLAALCVGFALSTVHTVVNRLFRFLSRRQVSPQSSTCVVWLATATLTAPNPTSSPPIALRI